MALFLLCSSQWRQLHVKGCEFYKMCLIVPNFTRIGQTVAELWQFNGFQNWQPSASWFVVRVFRSPTKSICMVVFMAMENLVEIDAVILII